ncbi:DNA methylase, partial [Anaerobutyricum soehngenii]|nr:DNA methylase [Anaerobutyricum soehngenii]
YGIPGRPRLFEVIQKVKRVNKERLEVAPGHKFIGQSFHSDKLSDPSVALAYITASPRMSLYMKYSTQIYQIYLRYFAPEDIHVYSIDEVFID